MNDPLCWSCWDSYTTHETRLASCVTRPKKRKLSSCVGKSKTRQFIVDDEDSLEAFLEENDLEAVDDGTHLHAELDALLFETKGDIDGKQDGTDENRSMKKNWIALVFSTIYSGCM
jgi:hypothetical protein